MEYGRKHAGDWTPAGRGSPRMGRMMDRDGSPHMSFTTEVPKRWSVERKVASHGEWERPGMPITELRNRCRRVMRTALMNLSKVVWKELLSPPISRWCCSVKKTPSI